MSLWSKFVASRTARHHARVHEVLTQHPELALSTLRTDQVLMATAMNSAVMLASEEIRRSIKWPNMSRLGTAHSGMGLTLPKVTPFNLRRFSEFPPSRRAINAIVDPILDMPWTIEPMPPASRSHIVPKPTMEQQFRIEIAANNLRNPNGDESFRVVMKQVLEDLVVGGYGTLEVVKTANPFLPTRLYTVDGATMRINTDWKGAPDIYRYSQSLGYTGQSVGTHEAQQFYDDQIIYFKLHPRTNTPFGMGLLEIAFSTVNAWLGAFEYAERRASNSTPNFGIFLGENVTPEVVLRWRDYWENEIEGYGKIPIMGGGRQASVMQFTGGGEDQLWLKWQELLIRIIALAFGLSPMKLGIERDVNRSTSEAQDTSDWETVAPVANTVQDYLTDKWLHQALGFEDLRFKWRVRDTDELRLANIMEKRWLTNSITADEIREMYDEEPMPDGIGKLTKMQWEGAMRSTSNPDIPGLDTPPPAPVPGRGARRNGHGAPVPLEEGR